MRDLFLLVALAGCGTSTTSTCREACAFTYDNCGDGNSIADDTGRESDPARATGLCVDRCRELSEPELANFSDCMVGLGTTGGPTCMDGIWCASEAGIHD